MVPPNQLSIRAAVDEWARAGAQPSGMAMDCLRTALHRACEHASAMNSDIPDDRTGDVASNAREKLVRHFIVKAERLGSESVSVSGSGAGFVMLVVRHAWIEILRKDGPLVDTFGRREGPDLDAPRDLRRRGVGERSDSVDPNLKRDMEVVFAMLPPVAAELLRKIDGGQCTIEELAAEELGRDPDRELTGQAARVRNRIDKQVQRARLAFRALWIEHGAPRQQ